MYLPTKINLSTGPVKNPLYAPNRQALVTDILYRHNTSLFKLPDGEEYARRSHSR